MNNFYIYADDESLKILSKKHSKKVLLVGSDFGYGNFGDIAQLKGIINFYYKQGNDFEPIIVYNIDSISSKMFIEKRRKQLNAKCILFISDKYLSFNEEFSLKLVDKAEDLCFIHLYGGGFLNSYWGEYVLNIVEYLINNLKIKYYIISGQQIDKQILPRLKEHTNNFNPSIFGTRDFESLELLQSASIKSEYSFDDAFEELNKIAKKIPLNKNNILFAHFNISSYTSSENKISRFNNYLNTLRDKYNNPTLTLFNAFDDKRFHVYDTISVIKEFEDEFEYINYTLIHGTRLLYKDTSENLENHDLYECLAAKIAITSSYHTAMLMQLSGTPCWLISSNDYYDQKRSTLEIYQTFDEFVKKPLLPDFSQRIEKRNSFIKLIKEFIDNVEIESQTIKLFFNTQNNNKIQFEFKNFGAVSIGESKWHEKNANEWWTKYTELSNEYNTLIKKHDEINLNIFKKILKKINRR